MQPIFNALLVLPGIALVAALGLGVAAAAEAPEVSAGRRIAERNCGECHATGTTGESRQADAPPFRTLSGRFDVARLPLALEDGMLVGHPRMPLIQLDADEVDALTAFLKSFAAGQPAAPTRHCGSTCV